MPMPPILYNQQHVHHHVHNSLPLVTHSTQSPHISVSSSAYTLLPSTPKSSSRNQRFHVHYNYNNKNYSFCLMVEASDHGYVLHTIRIQHQWRLAILHQFSVLIYAVCHILPSFFSYQGCVVHRWVFGGSMIY
jgi:hypothetical protein